MRRNAAARSCGVVFRCVVAVAGAGRAIADDGPPPLTPPELTAPVLEAPAELPSALDATPLPGNRGVLAIPGVTAPSASRGRRPVVSAAPVVPDLIAPNEMPAPVPPPESAPDTSANVREVPPSRRRPFTMMGTPPREEAIPIAPPLPPPPPNPTPGRKLFRPIVPPSSSRVEGSNSTLGAIMRRPANLLNRMLPPAFSAGRGAVAPDPSVTLEPRSDPAADATLKRRIEHQVRAAVGDRIRSVEVRVIDREIVISAQVDRFWHRRPVRRAIEALPALSGHHARVEVGD